jgi:flagellar M-ring protein FliF
MKKSQLLLIVLVIIITIVVLSVVVSIGNQEEYSVLFTDMEAGETGEVYSILEEMGVPVKSGPNGTILVPADQADEVRYKLNAQGYPKSGLNYDIYTENATSFGLTDADKKLYLQFQLEQNISQTINRMDKIKSSTVMITLPEDSVFVLSDSENRTATASVVLEMQDGATLTSSDADTIRAVISKSVVSLPPENITIADSKMNIYGQGTADGSGEVSEQIKLQNEVAEQLKTQIINLLSPVFGTEKLSASVNVVLDFDKSVTNSITLSPPVENDENTGIIVSMKEMEERVANGRAAEGEPGVDENGGAPVYQETTDEDSGDYYKVTRELNAEVNEINQQLERAQGQIKELSATLIIDGGDEVKDILPDVRKQIATAIGVPEDKITVSNMTFEQNTQYEQTLVEQTAVVERVERSKLIQTIIIAAAIIGAALIIILSLLARNKKKKLEEEAEEWSAQSTVDVSADEEISIEDLVENENGTLEQIKNLVRKDSELIAQLLKNWLSDDYMR